MLYNILTHAHSGLRWLVLIGLIVAIANAFTKWRNGSKFEAGDRKINVFAMVTTHIQLLIGFALYFISPRVVFDAASMKDAVARFFLVEHISLMLLAIILITIGFSKAKRTADDTQKFKTTFIFYLIGLLLILISIPWPFQQYGTSWF